jgi:hypothetical protein
MSSSSSSGVKVVGPAAAATATAAADTTAASVTAARATVSAAIEKVKTMDLTPTNAHLIGATLTVTFILILAAVLVYKARLKAANDDYMMNVLYPKVNDKLVSINDYDEPFSYLLRDYYIKTAYNCCCSGDFTNDYVSTNALITVIAQGARCLDFEIYSLDGVPVISASSQSEYTMKETINSLSLSEAFDIIIENAFSAPPKCPNNSDPLLLCLRIKSNNIMVYKEIAKLIEKKLASRLLDSRYGYAYNGDNLGRVKLSNFMGKIIIIVDETPGTMGAKAIANEVYKKTALYEYVNLVIRNPTSKKTFADVANPTPNIADVTEYSKKNIVFVLPERSSRAENSDTGAVLAHTQGHQLVAMSFQSGDAAMKAYNSKFDDDRHAFILKPANLRYTPLTVDAPTPVDPTRTLNSDMSGETGVGEYSI